MLGATIPNGSVSALALFERRSGVQGQEQGPFTWLARRPYQIDTRLSYRRQWNDCISFLQPTSINNMATDFGLEFRETTIPNKIRLCGESNHNVCAP